MKEISLPHEHGDSAKEVLKQIPDPEQFQKTSDLLKLLSDPTRARIFWILCHCEACVINISAMMEMSSPAVAHHLRLLRSSGLVEARREGKETYYRASSGKQTKMLQQTIEELMSLL